MRRCSRIRSSCCDPQPTVYESVRSIRTCGQRRCSGRAGPATQLLSPSLSRLPGPARAAEHQDYRPRGRPGQRAAAAFRRRPPPSRRRRLAGSGSGGRRGGTLRCGAGSGTRGEPEGTRRLARAVRLRRQTVTAPRARAGGRGGVRRSVGLRLRVRLPVSASLGRGDAALLARAPGRPGPRPQQSPSRPPGPGLVCHASGPARSFRFRVRTGLGLRRILRPGVTGRMCSGKSAGIRRGRRPACHGVWNRCRSRARRRHRPAPAAVRHGDVTVLKNQHPVRAVCPVRVIGWRRRVVVLR
jgi:hypothetical protein